jgi:riboflavin kinase / FMN adenylyltransferase
MQYDWQQQHPYYAKPISLALGSFDAIHYGHQHLLQQRFDGLEPWVLYFRQAAKAEQQPIFKEMVRSEQQRLDIFTQLTLKGAYALDFSEEIRTMDGISFMQKLIQRLHVKAMVVGSDFRFGYKAQTTAERLQAWAKSVGIIVKIVPIINEAGELHKYSSSSLREAILQGDFAVVKKHSGYAYAIDLRGMPWVQKGNIWHYDLHSSKQILPNISLQRKQQGCTIWLEEKTVRSTAWLEQVSLETSS